MGPERPAGLEEAEEVRRTGGGDLPDEEAEPINDWDSRSSQDSLPDLNWSKPRLGST